MSPVLVVVEKVGRHQPFEMPLIQEMSAVPLSTIIAKLAEKELLHSHSTTSRRVNPVRRLWTPISPTTPRE